MLKADRLQERMKALGVTQSELARRIGVTQPTIYRLFHGKVVGSSHLHRVARALGTTTGYLEGEIDDPDLGAIPPPPPTPPTIMMAVTLPPERALIRMFEALLAGIDSALPRDEQALLLAQRLPIGLSQLRDLRPEPAFAADDVGPTGGAEAPSTPDRELAR